MNYLYALVDPRTDSVRYIGLTCNPKKRYSAHLSTKEKNWRGNWIRELRGCGLQPSLRVLEKIASRDAACERERALIAEYRSRGCQLVNTTDGGEGVHDYTCSESTRQKLSVALTGRKRKPFTAAHRRNISKAIKALPVCQKAVKAMAVVNRGRKRLPETREKIRQAHLGMKHTQESRKRMSKAHKGRVVSAATRKKLSVAGRGRPCSPETREKMRRAALRREAKKRAERLALAAQVA